MSHGTVSHFDEGATVRFEREIEAAIDTVWKAITNEEEIARWLAPCSFSAEVGGMVRIDFGEDEVTGRVTICEPPHRLEYTWTFTGEPDSTLLFELQAQDGGTRLILEHRMLPAEQAVGYGAGWHAHLDMLAAEIQGSEPVDWDTRFNEVLASYVGA